MDDQQIRETLTAMITNLDPDAEYDLRHEDFVADMPQSRERIRGRENMWALQEAFPPAQVPTFELRRITGGGDVWTVEATGDYGGETQPLEAPAWRAQWVELVR